MIRLVQTRTGNEGVIYLIRNDKNGKCYVGQTRSENRFRQHVAESLRGSELIIHRAIRKHGIDSFSIWILWRGDRSLLNEKEMLYIEALNAFVREGGYNMTRGGDNGERAELVKDKISRSLKKRYEDDPTLKERCGGMNRGKLRSEESKQKNSSITREAWKDPEKRARFISGMKKSINPSRLDQMSASSREYYSKQENREAASQRAKRAMTPQVRRAISSSVKEAMCRPEVRAAYDKGMKSRVVSPLSVEALRKYWQGNDRKHSPETREKIRQIALRRPPMSEETKQKIARTKASRAYIASSETIEKRKKALLVTFSTPESKKKRIEASRMAWENRSSEAREAHREKIRLSWEKRKMASKCEK